MQKPVFKDKFKPLTAKRKKELRELAKRIEETRKDPKFLAYLDKRIARYHLE